MVSVVFGHFRACFGDCDGKGRCRTVCVSTTQGTNLEIIKYQTVSTQ